MVESRIGDARLRGDQRNRGALKAARRHRLGKAAQDPLIRVAAGVGCDPLAPSFFPLGPQPFGWVVSRDPAPELVTLIEQLLLFPSVEVDVDNAVETPDDRPRQLLRGS